MNNFLSYAEATARLSEGLNVIEGANAAGKTNLLDSIYLCAIGKSSRISRDKDLINRDCDSDATVRVAFSKATGRQSVTTVLRSTGQKCISIDDIPVARVGELLGCLTVVLFSPDEIALIKESPADRRRFLDISLSQQGKTYFYTLVKYNKLLAQRNKVLKDYRDTKKLTEMLTLIEEQMIPCEVFIMEKRRAFLEKLNLIAAEKHKLLTNGSEALTLSYETEETDGDVPASLRRLYEGSREKDARLMYTTVGVHRDDIKIAVDGIDVRKFGSQGQQRTSVLSMKLAECELHKAGKGEYPVLLLDDVLSELDVKRQKALLKAVKGIQTIVTCTEFDVTLTEPPYQIIKIGDRKILETLRR